MPAMDSIQKLWDKHNAARFPDGLAGVEVQGHCLISLDSCVAGCASSFLQSGQLDPSRIKNLHSCQVELQDLMHCISNGSSLPVAVAQNLKTVQVYYENLHRLSVAILKACLPGE